MKNHVLAVGDFSEGLDFRTRFLDRPVSGGKLADVFFRVEDFQPRGFQQRDARGRCTRDFHAPLTLRGTDERDRRTSLQTSQVNAVVLLRGQSEPCHTQPK